MHVRQRVHDALDASRSCTSRSARTATRSTPGAEAGRHRRPRRALPAPRGQAAPLAPQPATRRAGSTRRMHVRVVILLAAALRRCGAVPAAHAATTGRASRVRSCDAWQEAAAAVAYAAACGRCRQRRACRFASGCSRRSATAVRSACRRDGLGVWRKSRAGARASPRSSAFAGCTQGAVYRAVVHFRWHDADGDVIRTATPALASCCSQAAAAEPARGDSRDRAAARSRRRLSTRSTIVEPRRRDVAQDVGVVLRVDGEIVDEPRSIDAARSRARFGRSPSTGPVCRRAACVSWSIRSS